MNEKAPASVTCDELAAFALSGPGYPTRLAKAVHARVGMFRDQKDAVQSYVPQGQGGYVWEIDPVLVPDVPLGPMDNPLADSPADLSDQLLAILFGRWPPSRTPSAVVGKLRRPSIDVREGSWEEWQAAVDRG